MLLWMRKGCVFALFFVLGGCAYLEPLVQDFNIISVSEERQLGQQFAEQISKEMVLVEDPQFTGPVRRIGSQLVAVLPHRDFDYHFYVVKDASPNAFTIPGGSIYVHTGLFKLVGDDSELAGVLGHEIGHAYERHPAKAMSRSYGADFLTNLLLGSKNNNQIRSAALQIAKGGILTRYSREEELVADEVGYHLIRRAGYPGDGLVRFLKKLQSQGSGLSILSTHPPTPERVARLEALQRQDQNIPAGDQRRLI